MFDRIIMAQTESDVFWISAPNATCTCDIGKMAIDSTQTNIHFTGRVVSSGVGFMTKLSSLGIQQGTKNFGGSGQFYVGRACDMRGSQTCHATGWNDNAIVPIYGADFAANTTYRNHFFRGPSTNPNISGASFGYGIYATSGAGIASGTVYICGEWLQISEDVYTGVSRPWIIKLVNASIAWSVVWPSEFNGAFGDVAVMPNGNVVAAGYSFIGGDASTIVVFNPTTGAVVSQKKVQSLQSINSLAVASDNSIVIAGRASNQAYIGKTNSTLTGFSWQRRYNSGQVTNVAIDSGGNVIAIASISGNAIIYKFDPNGTLLWQRTFSTAATDVGYGLVIGANDCIYAKILCGANVVVAKLPADGSLTGTYSGYTYAAGAASNINITLGLANTAWATEGAMTDYPYTAGNWTSGTITWTGIPMQ
jgi:hypothetical protein